MSYWISFCNIFGNLIVCFYTYHKAINLHSSNNQKTIIAIYCFILAFIFSFRPIWLSELLVKIILCTLCVSLLFLLKQTNTDIVISAFLLSYGFSYCIMYLSMIIVGIFLFPFLGVRHTIGSMINFNNPIYILFYILAALFQFFLAFFTFKIKRIKNGFPFLFNQYVVIIALITTGIVIIVTSIVATYYSKYSYYMIISLIFDVWIIGAGIYTWVKRRIKMFYKRKMKERTIEILEQELAEKNLEIQRLTKQNDSIRVESHKISNRLSTLESNITKLANNIQIGDFSMEASGELAVTLENIKHLSNNYLSRIEQAKWEKPLPSTKINMIDSMFSHFSALFSEKKIDFNLKINGSIPFMVENIIQQDELETMIGDHLQDALIAINAGTNTFRSVLAILGLTDKCYEFTVFDSGIPFEIETLINLGTGYVTTHADEGGNGIGFMTTFETMCECKASLIISEKPPTETDFTKSVSIRFDGKNQYIIETYRSECFPNNERYLVIDNTRNP